MRLRTAIATGGSMSILLLCACGGGGSSAGTGGTGGAGGSAGTGGTGGSAGTGGAAGTGGTAGSGGTGGDAGLCETLPAVVDHDLGVGPGCVSMNRTRVENGATLTVAPGTEVRVAASGYMLVDDNGTLEATGTAAQPIVFTSGSGSPAAGDWQCIRFGSGSSSSQIRHATLEYGGAPCDANGAKKEAIVVIGSGIKQLADAKISHSANHGIEIEHNANPRGLENLTFADNAKPSILTSMSEVLTLGQGHDFRSAGDRIEVDTTFALQRSGHWLPQPVAFRMVGGPQISGLAEVTMDAGLKLEMTGKTFTVFNSNLVIEGTAADPVVFTSGASNPAAGDWGCLSFENTTGTPNIDHAAFEYAGSGDGCTGANYHTALNVPASANITDTTFDQIAGYAIKSSAACPSKKSQWCANTFRDVADAEVSCNLDQDLGCP